MESPQLRPALSEVWWLSTLSWANDMFEVDMCESGEKKSSKFSNEGKSPEDFVVDSEGCGAVRFFVAAWLLSSDFSLGSSKWLHQGEVNQCVMVIAQGRAQGRAQGITVR
ncbi:hypothetical protein EV426DRAFT_711904 [Tirmania nivea]|nr:hypothetical protein EV426DRAFT_711904 [Tirmania nivea]